MKARLRNIWELLHSSFWFVPALMALLALGLALVLLAIDERTGSEHMREITGMYKGGPEAALQLLSTIAGSMVTVTGVTFSITIVALTLASSQFGPRLLRNFMQDTGNQVVLGTFLSTFLYCLIILQAVSAEDGMEFVPRAAITVAILFAIISMGVLIYFIHHVASSIQAENVISLLASELNTIINRIYPEHLGDPGAAATSLEVPEGFDDEAVSIASPGTGYFKAVDDTELMDAAIRHDLVVQVVKRPGQYLIEGVPLFRVHPPRNLTDEARTDLVRTVVTGTQRTMHQDVEFPIDQLVEIAVRALSPGINDPFSAMSCVDRLGAGLSLLASRDIPSRYRHDERGNLRIIASATDFVGALDASMNQLRQNATRSPATLIRMLERLTDVVRFTHRPEDAAAIARHGTLIEHESRRASFSEMDLKDIQARYQKLMSEIGEKDSSH